MHTNKNNEKLLFDPMEAHITYHQIYTLLGKINISLVNYLEKILPELSKDWWNICVLNVLSHQQRFNLLRYKDHKINHLDLAALLKVMDSNWHLISGKFDTFLEQRHYLKEMRTIRNRWSHKDSSPVDINDVYRDLDTIQRFAVVIHADKSLIDEIEKCKNLLLRRENNFDEQNTVSTLFKKGDIVSERSNPQKRGVITEIIPGTPENQYRVFVAQNEEIYYESQIEVFKTEHDNFDLVNFKKFQACLTALQVINPGLSYLMTLNAARIDFIPYQFRPVLKFIRSDSPKLLIADSVGVGKTIEAGLILQELKARQNVKSVLIICPRPLVSENKWKKEMKRFDEDFIHLDGKALRYCVNEMNNEGEWPVSYNKVIIPFSLFDEKLLYGKMQNKRRRPEKGLLDLDPPPEFDMVIVDEAHHIRNRDTYTHKGVRFFCDYAKAVVFLTATPIQLGDQDLFVLLNTLRPDLVLDTDSFEHMSEPNPMINQTVEIIRSKMPGWKENALSELNKSLNTQWGSTILRYNPEFQRIRSLLKNGDIDDYERIKLLRDVEELHSFSGIINRTRRRDIGDFTLRKPKTISIEFTDDQKIFYDNLLNIQEKIYRTIHQDININFVLSTIKRQAASCIYGLVPLLGDMLSRHKIVLETYDDHVYNDNIEDVFIELQEEISALIEKAKNLKQKDPKLEALLKIIKEKQNLPNNKIMVFSSFLHTLNYLYEHLLHHGIRVGLIHGMVDDINRMELRNRFQMDLDNKDAIDVMLFSEVGSEGLDYQFCDCIVNYDLPWNPMRVEQRIGRIDRWGQKSDTVSIYNMITPNTIEANIYERCFLRIGIFKRSLGGSEKVLGEIHREIFNIAINTEMNEEEKNKKLQQLADNQIRLITEQEDLENKQLDLFGIGLPNDLSESEIQKASSYWLKKELLENLINQYLCTIGGDEQEYILGDKQIKSLRLSQEIRNRLLDDFKKIPRQKSKIYRKWERWLKGNQAYLKITFDSNIAIENSDIEFIMPLHPLVIQASREFSINSKIFTSLKVNSNEVKAGEYLFSIYEWKYVGIKEDRILFPFSTDSEITKHLGSLIELAEENQLTNKNIPHKNLISKLDEEHYNYWKAEKQKHIERIKKISQYKKESLISSHKTRAAILLKQIKYATDDKIIRMRQAQLDSAIRDYKDKVQKIEKASEKADIKINPVAYGYITVK